MWPQRPGQTARWGFLFRSAQASALTPEPPRGAQHYVSTSTSLVGALTAELRSVDANAGAAAAAQRLKQVQLCVNDIDAKTKAALAKLRGDDTSAVPYTRALEAFREAAAKLTGALTSSGKPNAGGTDEFAQFRSDPLLNALVNSNGADLKVLFFWDLFFGACAHGCCADSVRQCARRK